MTRPTVRTGKRATYPAYKPSGMDWVGDIPEHWDVHRLKHIASVQFSSVDKHTVDDEQPVRLCNYVDVYYNDWIKGGLDFMAATATRSEVERFKLRQGDVLITKDSEAWDDIAVPAYVAEEVDGVLCGYHLAHIRPDLRKVLGEYLFRAFRSRGINDQFRVATNGITRFGLGKYWLDNGLFPVPPLNEQKAIAAFLDRETLRIDALIEKKQRQIGLLQEKRSALISHAVTKGLDPSAPMKDSGVEWLGQIPAHWGVCRLKYLFRNFDYRRVPLSSEVRADMEKTYPYYGASGVIDAVEDYIFDEPLILVAEDGANLLSRSTPLAFIATGRYWVNNHAHILKPLQGPLVYWEGVLRTFDYTPLISGAAQPKLTAEDLGTIALPHPPVEEQHQITDALTSETGTLDAMANKISNSIETLREHRTALIAAAVTGKIDVRGEVAW